jgi:hypothetical protein
MRQSVRMARTRKAVIRAQRGSPAKPEKARGADSTGGISGAATVPRMPCKTAVPSGAEVPEVRDRFDHRERAGRTAQSPQQSRDVAFRLGCCTNLQTFCFSILAAMLRVTSRFVPLGGVLHRELGQFQGQSIFTSIRGFLLEFTL